MHDNTEAGVEKQEVCGREPVTLCRQLDAVENVEEHREWNVGGHRQAVGHRQSAEYVVDGRPHRRPGENDNVGRVGDDAQDTDGDGDMTVELSVPFEEQFQLAELTATMSLLRHRQLTLVVI